MKKLTLFAIALLGQAWFLSRSTHLRMACHQVFLMTVLL